MSTNQIKKNNVNKDSIYFSDEYENNKKFLNDYYDEDEGENENGK